MKVQDREIHVIANIMNMPKGQVSKLDDFIVVRQHKTKLWYYGAYTTRLRAEEAASELENGVVLQLWKLYKDEPAN